MKSAAPDHLHLVSTPANDNASALAEQPLGKPTLKDLIRLSIESFTPPPWEGKSKEAEKFFEVTSIHKSKAEWEPIFAGQQVIRNAFINTLPSETTLHLSALDYEKLVRFLDDIFVYMEGLYGLINNKSKQYKLVEPEYTRVAKLTFYPYDTEKGLKGLFQPKKFPEIEKELSPFARDLVMSIAQACATHTPFITPEGEEATPEEHMHEVQIRHYLSLLHHFITEMKVAMANKK